VKPVQQAAKTQTLLRQNLDPRTILEPFHSKRNLISLLQIFRVKHLHFLSGSDDFPLLEQSDMRKQRHNLLDVVRYVNETDVLLAKRIDIDQKPFALVQIQTGAWLVHNQYFRIGHQCAGKHHFFCVLPVTTFRAAGP